MCLNVERRTLNDLAQFFAVTYVIGLIVLLPRQRRLEREKRAERDPDLQRVGMRNDRRLHPTIS